MYDCYCDYEQPSVFSETRVKAARKEHRCCECRCSIRPGEPYLKVFGIWENEPQAYCLCERCEAAKLYVEAHLPCFCWAWGSGGEILSEMRDAVRDYQHECPGMGMEFGRMMVAIKRRADSDYLARKLAKAA